MDRNDQQNYTTDVLLLVTSIHLGWMNPAIDHRRITPIHHESRTPNNSLSLTKENSGIVFGSAAVLSRIAKND